MFQDLRAVKENFVTMQNFVPCSWSSFGRDVCGLPSPAVSAR